MKKLRIFLAATLCITLFCGCFIKRGEEKMQQAFDSIKTGENGTTLDEMTDMLGEGTVGQDGSRRWQNGSMLITVTVDDHGTILKKHKNW